MKPNMTIHSKNWWGNISEKRFGLTWLHKCFIWKLAKCARNAFITSFKPVSITRICLSCLLCDMFQCINMTSHYKFPLKLHVETIKGIWALNGGWLLSLSVWQYIAAVLKSRSNAKIKNLMSNHIIKKRLGMRIQTASRNSATVLTYWFKSCG
jgi:hypothetical protein